MMGKQARDVGERAIVERIAALMGSKANVLGLQDDCAAIPFGEQFLLASMDTLATSTHFPAGMNHEQMGRMAAAVNLSDIAAKGGEPLGMLLGLGLPLDFDVGQAEQIARGFASMAEQHGAEVLGGDTKPALELTLAVAALGTVPKAQLMPRSGIRPGDAILVTGELGGAAAGLAALQQGLGPSRARRLLEPDPRVAEGRALAASGAARACMDLSDGLAASLHQLARLNGCGFVVEPALLPIHGDALEAGPDRAAEWALQGGGDYELIVAVRAGSERTAADAVERVGGRLTQIGSAVAEHAVCTARGGKRFTLDDRGWDAFRSG